MKHLSKILSISLSIILLFSMSFTVLATPLSEVPGDFKVLPYYTEGFAKIEKIENSNIKILTEVDNISLSLKLNKNSIIIDNNTGKTSESLAVGDRIYVYYNDSNVVAIVTNIKEDATPAHLHTVENISYIDGNMRIGVGNGSLYITISKDATYNSGAASDIKVGTRLFAWYDVMLLSYPGFTGTDKVSVLSDRVNADDYIIVSNGKTLDYKSEVINGVTTVPLRQVAENLGFTVTWNAADKSIHLTNKTIQIYITVGTDSYATSTAVEGMIGISIPYELGAAPYITDLGLTYVPAEMFSMLGADFWQYNGVILFDIVK